MAKAATIDGQALLEARGRWVRVESAWPSNAASEALRSGAAVILDILEEFVAGATEALRIFFEADVSRRRVSASLPFGMPEGFGRLQTSR